MDLANFFQYFTIGITVGIILKLMVETFFYAVTALLGFIRNTFS